jgi:diguanylate cyclase (GGDEF)-like protein
VIRISIVTRILFAASLSLVLFALAMIVLMKTDLEHQIYRSTDARVQVAQNYFLDLIGTSGSPSLHHGELRLGKQLENGNDLLVDHVQRVAGTDATLFAMLGGRPIRIATTIRGRDGKRIVGTELVGPARSVVDAGRAFAGVSPIAGRAFLNRYDLLRDGHGTVVGVIYTGVPVRSMDGTAWRMMRMVLAVTCGALFLCLGLLYAVMRPLRRAFRDQVVMAQGLAAGDVAQVSRPASHDELGDVRLAFQEMIRYQQRMAGIADALAGGDFSIDVKPASERDRLGIAFASMSRNLKGLMEQLERSAMTDSLTQLGNRRAFDVRMRAELSRVARHGGNLSLALVDVDHFKAVNDDYGHQQGDAVLTKLAQLLKNVRAEDSAYRLGGDEFAIILADSTASEAMLALDRVLEDARAELLGTTVTIGVSTSPAGLTDGDALHRQADAALYVGKQRGRDTVVTFDDAQSRGAIPQHMSVHSVTRLIVEQGLQIFFQPIWDLRSGAILGFEALARPAATYALDGPQEAFDVATKIGRGHDLDTVCREAPIARAVDLPDATLLFLNVSPETLARGVLNPKKLAASFAAVGISPERVVLEITERLEGQLQAVIGAAATLREAGFRLALDDTGASYLGFEYLSRLRVDFIKIDAAVVTGAARDTAARGVIAGIVALAETTGAYLIAEGVEDAAMFDAMLRSEHLGLGRHFQGVQGYFFGHPHQAFTTSLDVSIAALLGSSARETTSTPLSAAKA